MFASHPIPRAGSGTGSGRIALETGSGNISLRRGR